MALLRADGTQDSNFDPQYGNAYFSALEVTAPEGDFINWTGAMLGDGDITATNPYPGY